jgi:hypothetical protein
LDDEKRRVQRFKVIQKPAPQTHGAVFAAPNPLIVPMGELVF